LAEKVQQIHCRHEVVAVGVPGADSSVRTTADSKTKSSGWHKRAMSEHAR
jgi:hypothetical protein